MTLRSLFSKKGRVGRLVSEVLAALLSRTKSFLEGWSSGLTAGQFGHVGALRRALFRLRQGRFGLSEHPAVVHCTDSTCNFLASILGDLGGTERALPSLETLVNFLAALRDAYRKHEKR